MLYPLRVLLRVCFRLTLLLVISVAFVSLCVELTPLDAAGVTKRAYLQLAKSYEYGFSIARVRGESTDVVEGEVRPAGTWFIYRSAAYPALALRQLSDGSWQERPAGLDIWVPSLSSLTRTLGRPPHLLAADLLRKVKDPLSLEGVSFLRAVLPCSVLDPQGHSPFAELIKERDCVLLYRLDREHRLTQLTFALTAPIEGNTLLGFTLTLRPPNWESSPESELLR